MTRRAEIERLARPESAVSICLALGNAARSAEGCVKIAQEAKKPIVVQAQANLAREMWDRAGWWAGNIADATEGK